MSDWWLLPLAAITSLALTGGLRRHALARGLIDRPNARSSHTVPTPRGGGVAIVLSFSAALVLLAVHGAVPPRVLSAILGAGGMVAVVGFLDDLGHVEARWRLLVHFVAAGWVLAWLGGAPPLALFGAAVEPGWVGILLATVYLVWVLNLYNFMDGIDGIAGVEAICVSVGAAALYALEGEAAFVLVPLSLAAAVVGFLYWNLPAARVFMGDAGSGFLGIVLGALSLHAAWVEPRLLWSMVILLGVFVTDATFTLIRRLVRGERIYEAHRCHAYQFAARRFGGHLTVTLSVGAINLFWLTPLAIWVATGKLDGLVGATIAYFPLVALAYKFNAGAIEAPSI